MELASRAALDTPLRGGEWGLRRCEPFLPVGRTLVARNPIPADPDGMNLPGVADVVQGVGIQH